MNRKWQAEIRDIINDSHRDLKKVRTEQQAQERARTAKLNEIKGIILPKLEYVIKIMHNDQDFAEEFRQMDLPRVQQLERGVEFIMPELSDVNRMDMHYIIEFDENNSAILQAYDKYSAGKMEARGSVEADYETFIEEKIKRFLKNWYNRKTGDELAKERMLELKITSKPLK